MHVKTYCTSVDCSLMLAYFGFLSPWRHRSEGRAPERSGLSDALQEEVRSPSEAAGGTMPPPLEPTPCDVERSASSFAIGNRIFDIENPEALAVGIGIGKDGNGESLLPPNPTSITWTPSSFT